MFYIQFLMMDWWMTDFNNAYKTEAECWHELTHRVIEKHIPRRHSRCRDLNVIVIEVDD